MGELIYIGEAGTRADLIVPPDTIDTTGGFDGRISVRDYQRAKSPDGTYDVCSLEDQSVVLLFKDGKFVYKKDLSEPSRDKPVVANNGTIVVTAYTDGGYPDGDHLLKAWDVEGTEIFATELRALTHLIAITSDGRFAALHTSEVHKKHRSGSRPEDAYDFSIYFIDLEQGQILGRYTDQIPGVKTGGGSRNMQIWDIEFVLDDSTPLLALYETENASTGSNKPVCRDDISDDTPLIDMRGNLVQYGRPNINKHPDHYYLTAEAKERLTK